MISSSLSLPRFLSNRYRSRNLNAQRYCLEAIRRGAMVPVDYGLSWQEQNKKVIVRGSLVQKGTWLPSLLYDFVYTRQHVPSLNGPSRLVRRIEILNCYDQGAKVLVVSYDPFANTEAFEHCRPMKRKRFQNFPSLVNDAFNCLEQDLGLNSLA
jgi:hypothetical protein